MKDLSQLRWLTKEELGSLIMVRERDTYPCTDPWLEKEDREAIIKQHGRKLSSTEIVKYNDPDDWASLDHWMPLVPAWTVTSKPHPDAKE